MERVKRNMRVAGFALLGVLILWYITRGQDLERLWQEFLDARFGWVFLSVIAGIISHYVRALRWNLLIRSMGQPARTSLTFHALMTGYLANLAVPRLGEITRCATLSKYNGTPFNLLAGSVIAERVVDMISLLILIFFTIIFQFVFLKEFLEFYIAAPLLMLMQKNIVLFVLLALVSIAGLIAVLKYFSGIQSGTQTLGGRIKRQMMGFWKGVISLASLQKKFLFLGYTFLIWFFYLLMVFLSLLAIQATAPLGIPGAFTILALGSLGIVAPVPGGVGTYHFIVILTLTELFGIASEPATSYAYISHASQMLMMIVMGSISWMALSFAAKRKPTMAKTPQATVRAKT